jgi:uncharacterized repeat protein (TIGR02543 family)
VFNPSVPQPPIKDEDSQYFYTSCLNSDPGDPACQTSPNGLRRLARKGLHYKLTGDKTKATIDKEIATEQFRELGPITVEYVAEFLKLYAPEIAISFDSNSTGTGTVTSDNGTIACGPICTASFVNGTEVKLSAKADNGSTFTGWGGDCTGTDNLITVDATKDKECTAIFSQAPMPVSGRWLGSWRWTSCPPDFSCSIGTVYTNWDISLVKTGSAVTGT